MASAKALSLAQEVRSSLVQRGIATVGSVALDTGTDLGVPYILIGAGTAGTQSAIVKIKEIGPLGQTIIGQQFGPSASLGGAIGYAQHVIQLVLEASTVGTGVPLLTLVNEMPILGELLARGTRVEVYTTANATAITTLLGATLPSANLRATFDASAQYRLMAQQ